MRKLTIELIEVKNDEGQGVNVAVTGMSIVKQCSEKLKANLKNLENLSNFENAVIRVIGVLTNGEITHKKGADCE